MEAPVTTMINIHSNVDFIPGALGFQLYQDEIGQESNTMVKLGYAYRLALAERSALSFGLNVSCSARATMPNGLPSTGWKTTPPFPPSTAGHINRRRFGVFLRKPNEYYAGISMTHVAEVQMQSLNIVPTRHYYFMGGYNYPLSGDDFVLRSNVLGQNRLPTRPSTSTSMCFGTTSFGAA